MLELALYALSGKDLLSAPVPRRVTVLGADATAAAAQISSEFLRNDTPDQVFIVHQVAVLLSPGAAQNALLGRVRLIDTQAGTVLGEVTMRHNPRLAAAEPFGFSEQCFVVLFGGEALQAFGDFSAGAAANTIAGSAHGWSIPRGNLQR